MLDLAEARQVKKDQSPALWQPLLIHCRKVGAALVSSPADDFAGGVGLLIWGPGPAPKPSLPSTWVARSERGGGTALPALPCLWCLHYHPRL